MTGCTAEHLLDDAANILHLIEADERIHFPVEFPRKIIAETLAHASGDDELLILAPLFQPLGLMSFEDGLNALLLRAVYESARIHDQHIGIGGIIGQRHAAGDHITEHDFGIYEVFGAAK